MNREHTLQEENERLQERLQEAEDLIAAIRTGKIDALVVSSKEQESVYTLQGADHTYRMLIETMDEGAIILSREEIILYCNHSFAQMLQLPLQQLIGSYITEYIAAQDREQFRALHQQTFVGENIRKEINLLSSHRIKIPSLISLRMFSMDGLDTACMVVTDLTEQKQKDASLAEKEVLLKEIHHRVKNNMQVISSLVDLQADQVNDPDMRVIFQDVINRVRTMAMIHEKLYQSTDLAHVDFADYTQSLVSKLWQAQGAALMGIELKLDLKPVVLPITSAVPCGLILNELFSNTLKHAFPGRRNGLVVLTLGKKSDKMVYLSVYDDGVGFAAGVDWEQSRSLGLRIVKMLARQIDAHVEVINDNGTKFIIQFER